jgi:trigger factor
VEVSQQEMSMLLQQAAQQYRPEARQRFVEYVQSEPRAAAQLRAPLYEDKVVDFLFDKADVSTREVTKDELQAAIEAEETAPADAKPAKKAAAKKPAAKKDAAPAEDAKPAKKAAAPKKEAAPKAEPKAVKAEAPAKKAPAKKAAAKK